MNMSNCTLKELETHFLKNCPKSKSGLDQICASNGDTVFDKDCKIQIPYNALKMLISYLKDNPIIAKNEKCNHGVLLTEPCRICDYDKKH